MEACPTQRLDSTPYLRGYHLGLPHNRFGRSRTVFQWPGMGMLAFTSLQKSDYPTLQGIVMVFAVIYLFTTFAVDVAYAYIDPRIRYS